MQICSKQKTPQQLVWMFSQEADQIMHNMLGMLDLSSMCLVK